MRTKSIPQVSLSWAKSLWLAVPIAPILGKSAGGIVRHVTWLGWQALVCDIKARPVTLRAPQAVDTTPPASPEDTLLLSLWTDHGPALLWPPQSPPGEHMGLWGHSQGGKSASSLRVSLLAVGEGGVSHLRPRVLPVTSPSPGEQAVHTAC